MRQYIRTASDLLSDDQMPDYQETQAPPSGKRKLRVLSLFSGCGGMDLGLEGGFIAPRKSFPKDSKSIAKVLDDDWVMLRRTRLETVFANDILPEAATAWKAYMSRYGRGGEIYSTESVVNLVKRHAAGEQVFPADVDIVTGGFPCQDFSLAGKRMGFNSGKSHDGKRRTDDEPSEETAESYISG